MHFSAAPSTRATRPGARALALTLILPAAMIAARAAAAEQPAAPCRAVTHEGARYTVCEADASKASVRLYWKQPDGQPYGRLGSLPASDGGKPLLFALNGGMFHADLRPVGLFVAGGKQLVPASTAKGPGNFHLKPNGIFWVGQGKAGVAETNAWLKHKPAADIATQSGPMLVIDGKLHPLFVRAEASRKYRDGVGVRADGRTIVFAISDGEVSFASFARFYRDVLKCPNALFLDGGSAPALYMPKHGRGSNLLPLGPMIGVYGG
jgi:uncharacterized protein YigE (DUF2233 family)